MTPYAASVDLPLSLQDAIESVTTALTQQGFGVLTRIDVHDVLLKKLGVERSPYVILGACNPHFAHRALEQEPAIGILLPCNVVVEAREGGSRVWITRPEALFSLIQREDMNELAGEVERRLEAVTAALAKGEK